MTYQVHYTKNGELTVKTVNEECVYDVYVRNVPADADIEGIYEVRDNGKLTRV